MLLQNFQNALFRSKGNREAIIIDHINVQSKKVIYLKCDIGYIHLRKGLEKTHIEWAGKVHSLHSLGAKNGPMSITRGGGGGAGAPTLDPICLHLNVPTTWWLKTDTQSTYFNE